MKKFVICAILDTLVASLLILGLWVCGYLIPDKGVKAYDINNRSEANLSTSDVSNAAQGKKRGNITDIEALQDKLSQMQNAQIDSYQMTKVALSKTDWRQKFSEKFSNTVSADSNSYKSPNLAIEITKDSMDSGLIDHSDSEKHAKYGTKIAYTVADIYVGDITCLQTAFADDIYGVGYTEKLSSMSDRMKSVLSVNGDSYSNNRHQNNGTIIRNGVIYRAQGTDMETCVLNWDGTMNIYSPGEINTQNLIDSGAYQSWIFGPSLLDEKGKAKTDFLTWDYIRESHPRTAIGYYEPGHYCLVVVDGRQADYSRGMFLNELAGVFEKLGCKAAYNLDGGHCSFMDMGSQTITHPYKPEHEIQDGIFLTEGLQ
ncbi:MAG: phosphodiester glycosidase family protein [Hespellia sp.]|nr:phosphodiester glycosidase family protein [Hespellia sp.]